MLHIENYLYASDLSEAYNTLVSLPGSVILGGCGYLRLGERFIKTAIDLSQLELDQIVETAAAIEIGAMTSLRALETSALIETLYAGVLKTSVMDIVGIQLRSCVTVGGTIAGRYPFSDLITALLAVDAQLSFFQAGMVSLEVFLNSRQKKDILVKIVIPKKRGRAAFTSVRKSKTDYAVLNVAASQIENNYRIVVGSRPGRALRVISAADYLKEHGLNQHTAVEAGRITASSLSFGSNPRGSAEYREAICPVLVQRALTEVMHED